ncbi:apurinic-apyrimidinic endonuclease-like [Styela clava]
MSCQGNTVGGKFQELRDIIEMIENKDRVGVCIDTCHAHAAGYDLSTDEGYNIFTEGLETIIGLQYVKAFHLNDSKGPSGCHKDRHENIGKGTIGLKGFERVMRDSRFEGIPMILETPFLNDSIYTKEIELLYSL